jgi:peptidoglycan/LPS O-acetylase OafA/YrhL
MTIRLRTMQEDLENPGPSSPSDKTITGKPHYEVLDGLRGSAAVMVVLFHIMGMAKSWADSGQLLHHAALAVDFFFDLSGFVVAYAYDDRWKTMSIGRFFVIRLVRLHPLVILGTVLGLLSFLFDPFPNNQKAFPTAIVIVDFALACFLIPYNALPNRWSDTHSLNSPAWSLMQEYIGNFVYALILRRLTTWLLGRVVIAAAAAMVLLAWHADSIDQGSGWESIWGGPIRVAFSFTMGLWLYRVRNRFPKLRLGWGALTVILAALFAMPLVPKSIPHWNGIYEAFVTSALFPLIIVLGAHSNLGELEMAACKLAGRMSYPIYILHFPFLLIYMNFVNFRKPTPEVAYIGGAVALTVVMAVSWFALTVYDEPVRKMLKPVTMRRKD